LAPGVYAHCVHPNREVQWFIGIAGSLSFVTVPLSPGFWLAFEDESQRLTVFLSFIFLSFDLELLVVNTQVSSANLEFTANLISPAP
jgi:hypothetical protein